MEGKEKKAVSTIRKHECIKKRKHKTHKTLSLFYTSFGSIFEIIFNLTDLHLFQ